MPREPLCGRWVCSPSEKVRNTAIPKLTPAKRPADVIVSRDDIARRAFEIYASGNGGSETDNWLRAERELRGV